MKNDLPGEGQENQPLAHSSVSDYLASKTVYGSLFGDSLPPHPVPGEYGILLRRLWHQRLGELQKLECLYTAPLFRQAVACPGYLLGDYDSDVSSASCKSAYLCPFCRAREAVLAYDHAQTAQQEYERKWSCRTAWYLHRERVGVPRTKLPGELGRMYGFNGLLHRHGKLLADPRSLVLLDAEMPVAATPLEPVLGSPCSLANAVARVFAYPWWLLLGKAETVKKHLDRELPKRYRTTGCLRSSCRVKSMAERKNYAFLPPRKMRFGWRSPCQVLEALASALHDNNHAITVLTRLNLPLETPISVLDATTIPFADAWNEKMVQPLNDTVNVLHFRGQGYVIAMPRRYRSIEAPSLFTYGDCVWVPLSRLLPSGQLAAPCLDAIWRQDPNSHAHSHQ